MMDLGQAASAEREPVANSCNKLVLGLGQVLCRTQALCRALVV